MEEIICFFKGHKAKVTQQKVERFVFFGEKAPQYRTENNVTCERCGKWQNPFTGKYLGA